MAHLNEWDDLINRIERESSSTIWEMGGAVTCPKHGLYWSEDGCDGCFSEADMDQSRPELAESKREEIAGHLVTVGHASKLGSVTAVMKKRYITRGELYDLLTEQLGEFKWSMGDVADCGVQPIFDNSGLPATYAFLVPVNGDIKRVKQSIRGRLLSAGYPHVTFKI